MSSRALTLLMELEHDLGVSVPHDQRDAALQLIRLRMQELSRDTRHTCAEAVSACTDVNEYKGDTDCHWIDADEAYTTCMNVKVEGVDD